MRTLRRAIDVGADKSSPCIRVIATIGGALRRAVGGFTSRSAAVVGGALRRAVSRIAAALTKARLTLLVLAWGWRSGGALWLATGGFTSRSAAVASGALRLIALHTW